MKEYTLQETKELFMDYRRFPSVHEERVKDFLDDRNILAYKDLVPFLNKADVRNSARPQIRNMINDYLRTLQPQGKTLEQIHQERRERQKDLTARLAEEVADYFSLEESYVSGVVSPAVKMNVTGYELCRITDGTNLLIESGLADLLVNREGRDDKGYHLVYAPDTKNLELRDELSRGLYVKPKKVIDKRPQGELWERKREEVKK